jgi:hypothetical protein
MRGPPDAGSLGRSHESAGWEMGGNKTSIWIKKGDQKVEFNILVPAPKGALCVVHVKRAKHDSNNEVANPAVGKPVKLNEDDPKDNKLGKLKKANPEVGKPVDKKELSIGQAHGKFDGHCGKALTRETTKVL